MDSNQIELLRHIRKHLTSHPDAGSKTLAAAMKEHFPEVIQEPEPNTPLAQPNPTTEARVFGDKKALIK